MFRRAHHFAFIALLVLSLVGHAQLMGGHGLQRAIETSELAALGLSPSDICGEDGETGHVMCEGCATCVANCTARARGVLPPKVRPDLAGLPLQWTIPADLRGYHPAQPRGPPVYRL